MNCNLISYDFIRFFWLKMSLKRAPISSKSSPNFKIELRTSRTLFPSPEVELNELEHLKSRTFRTRTQVRSITNKQQHNRNLGALTFAIIPIFRIRIVPDTCVNLSNQTTLLPVVQKISVIKCNRCSNISSCM